MYEFLCVHNHVDAARRVFMEGQRLGYRLDAYAMSGRLRKRADPPVTTTTGYSKRCQRDLDRFYRDAAENHVSSLTPSLQPAASERKPPSSFTVLKSIPLTLPPDFKSSIPIKTQRIVRKQKSLSYAKIRHSCKDVLHLSIDCHSASGEDNNSQTDTARSNLHRQSSPRKNRLLRRQSAEKRVKFKKTSSRTNSDSGEKEEQQQPSRANYLLQRNQVIGEKREKEYLNELFHSKSGEIERDVQGFVRLNYTLIGKYLSYENASYKHKLLQALRWRLNLNEKLTQRTLQDFVKHDLLRIRNNQYYEKTLMELLLWPPRNTPNANHLQNCMARLLNGIVSYAEGRSYIGHTSIVNHLIWGGENELYKVEPSRQFIDSGTAGMLVAAMMKLSTVAWQRRDMLNKNVLNWTLGHLEDIEYSGTVFQTKYTLTLLNSLLRLPEAVEELTRRTSQVLVLLARYLKREKSEWFFTVKSILVKLFKHRPFRQAAKEMNFETLLRKLINPLDFKAKKEIELMILYLNDSGNITQLPCSASVFEVEEKIVFDAEIEADDVIVGLAGVEGELLLEDQFAKYRVVYQREEGEQGEGERKSRCEELGEKTSAVPRVFSREVIKDTEVGEEPIIRVVEQREEELGNANRNVETKLNPDISMEKAVIMDVTSEKDELSIANELESLRISDRHELVEGEGKSEGVDDDDDDDDDNDVVVGQLKDEGESLATNQQWDIIVVPPSESESPTVSVARTFPNSLSLSSLSSLEEAAVVEPKILSQFPRRKNKL